MIAATPVYPSWGSLKALLFQFPSMKLGFGIPVAVNPKRTLIEFKIGQSLASVNTYAKRACVKAV